MGLQAALMCGPGRSRVEHGASAVNRRHAANGINEQGLRVWSFVTPSGVNDPWKEKESRHTLRKFVASADAAPERIETAP
jgi:hypothetical protein